MPTSEHPEPKSLQAIKRDLGRWHLLAGAYIVMMVLVLVFAFSCGWHLLAFFNSGLELSLIQPERTLSLIQAKNTQSPFTSHLNLSLLAGIITFALWIASRHTEKLLMSLARQRRSEHSFYGKFIEGKRVLERR